MNRANGVVRCLAAVALAISVPWVAMAGSVDINKADAVTIAKELKGIGPAKAKAIVDYRSKNGAFKSVDDLRKIKGIGEHLLEQNRSSILIGTADVGKKSG